MDKPLVVKNKIVIKAPLAEVWDTLVNPEKTKLYMFGCEAISNWKEGDTLVWKMNHEGKEMIPVSGYVLSIEPNQELKYSVIDPNADMEDIPENYLRVTYQVAEENGLTTLIVIQDGFENAANGKKRYEDAYNNGQGWEPLLVEIKKVAESA